MKKGGSKKANLASIWRRLVAFIIDMLILDLIIAGPFKRVLQGIVPADFGFELFKVNQGLAMQVTYIMSFLMILYIAYFTVMQYYVGQSLGMMLFKIKIDSEDTSKLSLWKVLVSHLWLLPFFPFVLLWIIEPLSIIFTKNHQRLLQKLTKIIMVEE